MSVNTQGRPLKRQRLAPSETTPSAPKPNPKRHAPGTVIVKRHGKLYYEDGNIVLVAEGVAFRVYSGLLAAQSTVFADMFVAAHPSGTCDQCPMVKLSDSAHDLEHLLNVLIPKEGQNFYYEGPVSFDQLFSAVRLAHKYNITSVEQKGIAALKKHFTSSFGKWSPSGIFDEPEGSVYAIGAVILARLTDTPSILPTALHACGNTDGRQVKGWVRPDGSVERLSEDDLMRSVSGSLQLAQRSTNELFAVLNGARAASCTKQDQCQAAVAAMRCHLETHLDAGPPWLTSVQRSILVHAPFGLCFSCVNALSQVQYARKKAVWEELPKIFGVEVEEWGKEIF